MKKEFKAFDKILVRDHEEVWQPDLYGFWDKCRDRHQTMMNNSIADADILPYEGNEHLVGTSDSPDEEVRLEEGELLVCSDDLVRLETGHGVIENFVRTSSKDFYIKQGGYCYNFCIRFSDFNPNDMEATKAKILCVKNGKIVKYKG